MMLINNIVSELKSISAIGSSNNEVETQTAKKLLLIIKARWVIAALLVFYLFISSTTYMANYSFEETISFMIWPSSLLILAVVYNSFYHLAWHYWSSIWVPRVRLFIRMQLVIDALLATVLIHFTGGVLSWFWTIYLLLIIECAQLAPNQREVIITGLWSIFFYSFLLAMEFFKIITPVKITFLPYSLHGNITYVLIVWFWVFILNTATVFISYYLKEKENTYTTDALTNVYNRRFFDLSLKNEIERAKKLDHNFSLLLIDVDNLKEINDKYGHIKGDIALKIVADIISSNIRKSYKEPAYNIDIACRYGGDEFAVILPESRNVTDDLSINKKITSKCQEGAIVVAERLRDQIAQTTDISVSIGIATYPYHGNNFKSLIKTADKALYDAKSIGKNTVVVYPLPNDIEKPKGTRVKANLQNNADMSETTKLS